MVLQLGDVVILEAITFNLALKTNRIHSDEP
jgi:hypothetical protein